MSDEYFGRKCLPGELNNFRTLLAQNRGYHYNFPNGNTIHPPMSHTAAPIDKPYYTGFTVRVFCWAGDTTASLSLGFQHPNYRDAASINIDGTRVRSYEKYGGPTTTPELLSNYTLQIPGYFTVALRMELPSHILAIFGENHVFHRSERPKLLSDDLYYTLECFGSTIKPLSLHVSDEQGKGSSTVILKPIETYTATHFGPGVFVVIECYVVDCSQEMSNTILS